MEMNQSQKYVLMQANTNGRNIKFFFERNRHSFKRATNNEYLPCNCPDYESIDKIFTIDHSDTHNMPQIIFIDSESQNIVSADKHGCDCTSVINKSWLTGSFPIHYLTTDKNKIYWSNATNGLIYSMNMNNNTVYTEKMNGKHFLPLGSHVQPFPITNCLIPRQVNYQVIFHSKTDESITLIMPPVVKNDGCDDISMASVEYIVYYMPYNDGGTLECNKSCNKIVTFEKVLKVTNLKPFTKYLFSLAVRNYYSKIHVVDEFIGPGVILQTAAGGK